MFVHTARTIILWMIVYHGGYVYSQKDLEPSALFWYLFVYIIEEEEEETDNNSNNNNNNNNNNNHSHNHNNFFQQRQPFFSNQV